MNADRAAASGHATTSDRATTPDHAEVADRAAASESALASLRASPKYRAIYPGAVERVYREQLARHKPRDAEKAARAELPHRGRVFDWE